MIYINQSKIDSKYAIVTLLSFIIIPIIYASTIINMSGYGDSIGSNNITLKFCMLMMMIFYIINIKYGIKKIVLIYSLISFLFLSMSISSYNYIYAIQILALISSIYVFSFIGRSIYCIKLISYLYPLMTIYILNDFNSDGITGGWNTNVIGMIGFIGIIFIGYNLYTKYNVLKIVNILMFFYMISLLEITDNRSAYLGIAIAVVLNIIFYINKKKERKLKWIYIFIYCIPIIIVSIIIILYRSPISNDLNTISLEYTDKPFFSGREEVWNNIINGMKGFWLLGHGEIIIGNAHNIFMNFLYSYGIIGYTLYAIYFISTLNSITKYIDDYIIRYSIVTYLSIYIQQSFECILLDGVKMILLPYVFLMIAIGRWKYINDKYKGGNIQDE